MLRPTMLFVSVTTMIGYLQFFEEPFVMTNGGPLNSTMSMSLYTYRQFGFGNIGVSSAASFLLLLIVALVSALQFRLLRSRS